MISSMESTTVQLKSLKIKPALFLHKKDNKKNDLTEKLQAALIKIVELEERLKK